MWGKKPHIFGVRSVCGEREIEFSLLYHMSNSKDLKAVPGRKYLALIHILRNRRGFKKKSELSMQIKNMKNSRRANPINQRQRKY